MNEKALTKLSFVCSMVGLITIYAGALSTRPQLTPISSLDDGFVGLKVVVSGQVVDIREHREGHLFLKLRDDSGGVISVPIFSRLRAEFGERIELLDVMEVTGEVDLYREVLEVIPDKASDIRVIHTAPVRLSSLNEDNAGAPVKVEGTIVGLRTSNSGSVILTLREDESQLHVFIPSVVAEDGLPELSVGDTLRVSGWLQIYNGELELKVVNASQVSVTGVS